MPDRLTPRQFRAAEETGDWTVLFTGACAAFRTGSFARGVQLVEAIGRLADDADHHPDVDLRYARVTVRLWSHDVDGLSERDVALARAVSHEALRLGADPEPDAVQDVRIAVDAVDVGAVTPFWGAVLGYRRRNDEHLVDRAARGPGIRIHQVGAPRPPGRRLHVDLAVPPEVAAARVTAALEEGGVVVRGDHAPTRWTLADPEGNEVDVAILAGPG